MGDDIGSVLRHTVRHHFADVGGANRRFGHGGGILADVAANLDRVGTEVGLDIARAQHRDANPMRCHFAAQLFAERGHAEFRHRIGADPANRGDEPGLR